MQEEVVIPDLIVSTPQGLREARLDVVFSRPGGLTRHLVDVRTVDSRADRYSSTDSAFFEADGEKDTRYSGQVFPFPIEHRGKLGRSAVALLHLAAEEAALIGYARPAHLLKTWRRALALVCAFEIADAQRSVQLCMPGDLVL